jgi:S1-C subfamily serine protease
MSEPHKAKHPKHQNHKPSLEQLKKMTEDTTEIQNGGEHELKEQSSKILKQVQHDRVGVQVGNVSVQDADKGNTKWFKNGMLWTVVLVLVFSLGLNILSLNQVQILSNKNQDSVQLLKDLNKRLGFTETEVQNLNAPVASPSEIVQKALKSVVVIEKQISSEDMTSIRNNVKDQYLSRAEDKDALNQASPTKDLWESLGSGVVLASTGEIITNKHIVATAGRYRAKTIDGQIYPLRRAMLHPYEDLAIVVAQDQNASDNKSGDLGLTPIELETKTPTTGEEIYALGHPAKLSFSVSKGIISNPNRNFGAELDNYLENLSLPEVLRRAYFDKSGQEILIPLFLNSDLGQANLLQHSAAISLGSSGGAIINTQGKLLGINTFGVQRQDSDTYNLIPNLENPYQSPDNIEDVKNKIVQGYTPGSDFNTNGAIKSEVVQRIWQEYQNSQKNQSKFSVPYLGFYVASYGQSQAALMGYPVDFGVQIVHPSDRIYKYDLPAIDPNGPAKDLDLKEGDIIGAINGTELNQKTDIGSILGNKKIGDTIKITYYRQNSSKVWIKNEISLTLGSLPAFDEDSLKGLRLGDIQL